MSDVTSVIREKVLGAGDRFIMPEDGLNTVRLWVRSAAMYLKMLQLKTETDLATVGQELVADVEDHNVSEMCTGMPVLNLAYSELLNAWQYLEQHEEENREEKI